MADFAYPFEVLSGGTAPSVLNGHTWQIYLHGPVTVTNRLLRFPTGIKIVDVPPSCQFFLTPSQDVLQLGIICISPKWGEEEVGEEVHVWMMLADGGTELIVADEFRVAHLTLIDVKDGTYSAP